MGCWKSHIHVETAAHLVYRVFPPLPVRQWVLSLPKWLRYFLSLRAMESEAKARSPR